MNSDEGERRADGERWDAAEDGAAACAGGVALPPEDEDAAPPQLPPPWLIACLPKELSAMEAMEAVAAGARSGGKPPKEVTDGGRPAAAADRRCESGEVRYSRRKASSPARPTGRGGCGS